jgi:hypothetical protein
MTLHKNEQLTSRSGKHAGTFRRTALAAGFAVLLLAAPLAAQSFQGRFTLPVKARWGKAILPPGNYTLTLARFRGGQRQVIVQGEAKGSPAALMATESEDFPPLLSKNSLVCFREGGTLVVRALEVSALGEIVYFHMPSGTQFYTLSRGGEKHPLVAQAPQLMQRVPVVWNGE